MCSKATAELSECFNAAFAIPFYSLHCHTRLNYIMVHKSYTMQNVMHHILLPSEKGHYHLNAAFVVRLSRQTLVDGALREPCATADYNIVCLPLIPTIVAPISFRYFLF